MEVIYYLVLRFYLKIFPVAAALRFVGWVDARKPNNFLEYFHNVCWVSPFEPMGNTRAIMIAQPNLRLD
jgi:hypothetical protein